MGVNSFMKKIVAFFVAAALAVTMAFSVGAAGLSASEQKILDALTEGIPTAITPVHIPDHYIDQARNFLLSDDSIDEAKAEQILAKINEAKAIAKTLPVSTREQISMTDRNKFIALASEAAAIADCTLTVSDDYVVTITKNGVTYFYGTIALKSENPIKQTDTDAAAAAVAVAATVICALGATLLISRKVSAK